jgi:hypothetical protein
MCDYIIFGGHMRKITFLAVLSIFFSFTSYSYSLNEARGNSIGNVANCGLVVENLEYVFYSSIGEGLIKEQKNGGKKTRICEFDADNLNIVGDYIYCRLYNIDFETPCQINHGIYKVKTDGSIIKKLNDDEAEYMNIVGNNIFYVNANDHYKPYKMKLDGTGRRKINDYPMSNINIIGDWIYFENHIGGAALYKMKTDGSKMTKLNDDCANRMMINVIGDWIYYIAYDYPQTGLYKVKTDGTQRTKLTDQDVFNVNVIGDTIYYSVIGDGLYEMKTSGKGKKNIIKADIIALGINIANGWIYYYVYDDSSDGFISISFRKIKTDGGKAQNIFTRKIATEN